MPSDNSQFSALKSALGYFYQPRYALLQLLRLPEETVCLIEKDDDIDFTDAQEGRVLASLKHKAPGNALTDLSPDFWKSVRIWLDYYLKENVSIPPVSFFLFTTGYVAVGSFLEAFLPNAPKDETLAEQVSKVLAQSKSKTIQKTKNLLEKLPKEKWRAFFRRITIFDNQERIQDIPQLIINEKLRTVRPQFRRPVYERLEGWWNYTCIDLLSGRRNEPLRGSEVSEVLSFITEQFHEDNLPVDFEHSEPKDGVHPDSDDRYFVKQLRAVGLHSDRLRIVGWVMSFDPSITPILKYRGVKKRDPSYFFKYLYSFHHSSFITHHSKDGVARAKSFLPLSKTVIKQGQIKPCPCHPPALTI